MIALWMVLLLPLFIRCTDLLEELFPKHRQADLHALLQNLIIKANPSSGAMAQLRRLIALAYELDTWEKHNGRSTLEQLAQQYLKFYYRFVAERSTLISHLHVSKSAGTSLCALVHSVAEQCHAPPRNCWAQFLRDGPHWLPQKLRKDSQRAAKQRRKWYEDAGAREADRDGCEQRAAWMRDNNVTFAMIESYLPGGELKRLQELPCQESHGVLYSIAVRSPHAHSMSMSAFLMHVNAFKPTIRCSRMVNAARQMFDNPVTRALLGGKVFRAETLTDGDGRAALRQLARFDLVTVVEEFGQESAAQLYTDILGFAMPSTGLPHERHAANYSNNPCFVSPWNNASATQWTERHKHDLRLHEAAKLLSRLDKQFFHRWRHFAQENKQNCETKCGLICHAT